MVVKQVVITMSLSEVASFVNTSQDRSNLLFDNDVYFVVFHRNASFQEEFVASAANATHGTVVQLFGGESAGVSPPPSVKSSVQLLKRT